MGLGGPVAGKSQLLVNLLDCPGSLSPSGTWSQDSAWLASLGPLLPGYSCLRAYQVRLSQVGQEGMRVFGAVGGDSRG